MFPLFSRPQLWGGSEDALLAMDDLYTALGLAEFEGRQSVNISELSSEPVEYVIPDSAVLLFRATISQGGQHPNGARIVAGVLRRIRLTEGGAVA